MGRISKEDVENIVALITKICKDNNTISPTTVAQIAQEQYGKSISHKTLVKYCNQIVLNTSITENDTEYETNLQIIEINERMNDLKKEFKNATSIPDKCKLSGQIDSAQESKAKIKKILREADNIKQNTNAAKVNVYFDGPSVVESKKPFFKTDDKQKALSIKEGDEKS